MIRRHVSNGKSNAMTSNWMELNLTPDQEQIVRDGAKLYRQMHPTYPDTMDYIFRIANGIDILQKQFSRSGVKGAFTDALIQYGYTARDAEQPMNKAIRSHLSELLKNEQAVRAWWTKITKEQPRKVREWVSPTAIYRNWKASLKPPEPPRRPDPVTQPARPAQREPEAEIDPASLPKSYRERFEAMCRRQAREFEDRVKQQANAEGRRLLDDIFLPHLRKRLEDAERQNKHLEAVLDRRRPIISKRLLRLLQAAAHSDRSGSHELAVEFNSKRQEIEIALCGKEADRPKGPPLPTWAEMMANRAAYDAKNRERAKRAAATRGPTGGGG